MNKLAEQTNILASYLPTGRIFDAKRDDASVLRSLLRGFASGMLSVDDMLDLFRAEVLPNTTTDFIEEWESAVGIPDECFDIEDATIEERRLYVTIKLASLGVQTSDDFGYLATLLGTTVTVRSGMAHDNVIGYGTDLPVVLFPDLKTARFTIIVAIEDVSGGFPYTFPFPFGTTAQGIMECLFSKLKPANCDLLFVAAP